VRYAGFLNYGCIAHLATDGIGAVRFMWKFPNHPWSPKFLKYYSTRPIEPAPAARQLAGEPQPFTQDVYEELLARARDLVLWHPSLRSESWFQDLVKGCGWYRPPSEREYGPGLGPYRWGL